MRKYNLVEAAQLLCVSLATLRRWRVAAGGAGARGTADGRRVWLSRAEVAELARQHGRVLVDSPGGSGGNVMELEREVEALHLVAADLRARVLELESKRDAASE